MGIRVTVTAEARATLAAALELELAPVPVHPHPPAELATPCVYLDVAGRRAAELDGAPITVVTFPVVAVADGADAAQVAALDDLGDRVWSLAYELKGEPSATVPGVLDTSGPRLRTATTTVDVIVEYLTLCPPSEAAA